MSRNAEPARLIHASPFRIQWLAVAAIVTCLGFAAFTGHIWEDYFITFRASLNLATGNGLVFQPGERVHTFTSPLGTLLPALFAIGGGDDVALRALWGLRIVSAAAVGAAVWMAVRVFQKHALATPISAGIGIALVLDPKIVDFSINGMETGLIVFFVVLAWFVFVPEVRVWPCALACAGLQWTRPDGFVLFGALAAAWITFGRDGTTVRVRCVTVAKAVTLGIVLYVPWLVIAWWYYGSPIPHTILAKSQPRAIADVLEIFLRYPWRLLAGHTNLHDVFKPAYFFMGGWPAAVEWFSRLLATVAALAWIWPRVLPAGRIASAAFFLGGLYVAYIPIFPWYYPGWQVLGFLAWAFLLHALWTLNAGAAGGGGGIFRPGMRILIGTMVAIQAVLFVCVAWQMKTQQAEIEAGHRAEIGRWLARNASRNDTVFVECLGYIGYYSKLKMLDYPGLSAPEVVAARKAGHRSFARVIDVLHPTWVVLRPREVARVFGEIPELRTKYEIVREFDVRQKIDALPLLPGRGYLNFDAVFHVYRRQPSSGSP